MFNQERMLAFLIPLGIGCLFGGFMLIEYFYGREVGDMVALWTMLPVLALILYMLFKEEWRRPWW